MKPHLRAFVAILAACSFAGCQTTTRNARSRTDARQTQQGGSFKVRYAAVANVHAPSVKDPPAVDDSPKRYEDVRLTPTKDEIVFGNRRVELRFGRKDGAWTGLTVPEMKQSLISAGKPAAAVDFRIDEKWMVETHGATFLRHEWEVEEKRKAASLKMIYGVIPRQPISFIPERWQERVPSPIAAYAPADLYEYELTAVYTLRPDERRIERSATLARNLSKNFFRSSFRRHDGFLFVLPGAVAGDPADCTVEVPGPLFTYTYIDAGTPYTKLAGTFIDCKTIPDRLPGIVGIDNKSRNLALATWMDTKAEVVYQAYLSGDGKNISVLFHDMRSERLPDAAKIRSDTQHITITDGFPAAQAEHRRALEQTMPVGRTTPAWVKEMVILEMMPHFHGGGFKGLAEHLPFYRDLGFNTLYLLPHWQGGYGNADPMAVDESLGTPAELKALVKRAHDLGMRVLFDMVIHGFAPDGPVAKKHPEFFTRNEHGLIETHFNWGSLNTDPHNEAYQQYLVDLVLHDLREYDIDGYRIDAASFKSPNWDPKIAHKPWQASSTIPLYRRMYEAMQKEKPDVVFYSEMFGPAFHAVSNLAQDANWAVVTDVFGQFDRGEINAATYKAGMVQLQGSMQRAANRIRFCRNHDTSWFFPKHYKGFTPRFLALDAVHILFGVPVVFAGDREHPPSLEDDPKACEHYKRVIALRERFPEFAKGEILLREIECDNEWVFSGLRGLGDDTAVALVSLSEKPQAATLTLTSEGKTLAGVTLLDPADGTEVTLPAEGPITLTLKPFQMLVGRLER